MTTKKYHRDTGIPPQIKNLPERMCEFYYISEHVRDEAKKDGIENIPQEIYFSGKEVFEVEVHPKGIKLAVRLPYDRINDIIYVIQYNDGYPVLTTLWLNDMFDSHKTLDESKYTKLN